MDVIVPFLGSSVFEPEDIDAMAIAFDDVCKVLKLDSDARAREIVAARIIQLARRGERSPSTLRDRMLVEAGGWGVV